MTFPQGTQSRTDDPPLANPGPTYMCCGAKKGDAHRYWCVCSISVVRRGTSDTP